MNIVAENPCIAMVSQVRLGWIEIRALLKLAIRALDTPPPARMAPQKIYHLEVSLEGEKLQNQQQFHILNEYQKQKRCCNFLHDGQSWARSVLLASYQREYTTVLEILPDPLARRTEK